MIENIFDVVIGKNPKPLKWDAAWRVIEWLANPEEGHGLRADFCNRFTEVCFGRPLSPVGIKVEFKLGVDANGEGKWPDMVVAHPSLNEPRAIALIDDVSARSPNDSRKIGNLRAYAKLATTRFPNATRSLVVVTDSSDEGVFVKLKASLNEMADVRWQLLPLRTLGVWLENPPKEANPIVHAFGQWARRFG